MVGKICYESSQGQVSWHGVEMLDNEEFEAFVSSDVAARLFDYEGSSEYETHLRNLISTGFEKKNLDLILASDISEDRDWAIGEATAETYLTQRHNVIWPWNTERDKRTPFASLPGADLVGFRVNDEGVKLVLGEVKSSADHNAPPNVMYGRSGMTNQLDKLASNLGLLNCLLKWLLPRCKNTRHEELFNKAALRLFQSENKDLMLFGILIRDTNPHEMDLKSRGIHLANTLVSPAKCKLIALYLPCLISELPTRISRSATT